MDATAAAPFVDEAALEKKVRSGTSWFFLIAALSVVNTVMQVGGSDRSFLVGLASTQVVDAIANVLVKDGGPPALRWIAFAVDAAVASAFVAFGVGARKRAAVYVAGIAVYVLDAVVAAAFQDWPMTAFHVFVLVSLVGGYLALRKLRGVTTRSAPVPAAVPAAEVPRNPLVR